MLALFSKLFRRLKLSRVRALKHTKPKRFRRRYRNEQLTRIPALQISTEEMEWLGDLADFFESGSDESSVDGIFFTPNSCRVLASRLRSVGLRSSNRQPGILGGDTPVPRRHARETDV
jgi:hypothetical protein